MGKRAINNRMNCSDLSAQSLSACYDVIQSELEQEALEEACMFFALNDSSTII